MPILEECSIEHCNKQAKNRGWCSAHYTRWNRNGSTGSAVVRPRVGRPQCKLDSCDQTAIGRGYCSVHYRRDLKHGSPDVGAWEVAHTYSGAHQRTRSVRGPAAERTCISCDQPAQEWAYNGRGGSDERWSDERNCAFSLNPGHYVPMCIPCHRIMDLSQRQQVSA